MTSILISAAPTTAAAGSSLAVPPGHQRAGSSSSGPAQSGPSAPVPGHGHGHGHSFSAQELAHGRPGQGQAAPTTTPYTYLNTQVRYCRSLRGARTHPSIHAPVHVGRCELQHRL